MTNVLNGTVAANGGWDGGATGVGLGSDGTLYNADSASNRIAAIPNALTRSTTAGGTTVSANSALVA